jgi:pimeloyl-ACP methyl ester carboxylesterase
VIGRLVESVRSLYLSDTDGVVIIGHSIGGAVALTIASQEKAWDLRGIAVSGIGFASPTHIREIELPPDQVAMAPPPELTDSLFYDP